MAQEIKMHEQVLYSVSNEDVWENNEGFYDWLCKQGDDAMGYAVALFADKLMRCIDISVPDDDVYDCLNAVMDEMGYEDKED